MPFCSLPLFVSFSPSRSLCLSCVCAHACVSVSFTAEPVRQGSGCVRDDSVADRKPARLACCPQVSVALVSAPAGVWAQDEVAAVKSFQLSAGCSFPCPFHWNRDSGQSRWSRPTMPHPALEPQGKWPGAGMNAETELLWPGAALLLLLGAVAASLCVRCSRSGVKRSEKICEQRNLPEDQQNFSGAWTYSLARPMVDRASNMAAARKDKLLQFSPSLEETPPPWTVTSGSSSRSPRKMMTTMLIPMRTCSSASRSSPTQVTRSLRITRTRLPSSSGRSPEGSWGKAREEPLPALQEARTRMTKSPIM
ncbi:linker for activation of T-cells family member 2 isoform X6 [Artibeus jamaicensis]|uniref:linker for activation of T-cells family member 2 isoform X6 n=1 Tax=Artibeus jamaicensis TaxID=9417 RepID=UPI00235ACB6A|nr:linker for activation of T-cells family member 2 isoform X6 [Artibeus jamaicensis]